MKGEISLPIIVPTFWRKIFISKLPEAFDMQYSVVGNSIELELISICRLNDIRFITNEIIGIADVLHNVYAYDRIFEQLPEEQKVNYHSLKNFLKAIKSDLQSIVFYTKSGERLEVKGSDIMLFILHLIDESHIPEDIQRDYDSYKNSRHKGGHDNKRKNAAYFTEVFKHYFKYEKKLNFSDNKIYNIIYDIYTAIGIPFYEAGNSSKADLMRKLLKIKNRDHYTPNI